MKIMATSFKMFHAGTATPSAPIPAAGRCQPMPLQETPGHSWASLGQSLVGSLLLLPGPWWMQGFVCVFQESVSLVLCKFWYIRNLLTVVTISNSKINILFMHLPKYKGVATKIQCVLFKSENYTKF